ncbi:hypothetical protein MN116_006483 [Schistosoma mekongi]|uniref:Leishmanolysin-like peptidase n=1 Tax=Schistosoma mekongi TaxID=38744 RepID=A0AAE2D5K6_SCHME|nr:hypothetical protein MN116_006483 [Schistosoma mekongi]
MQRDAIYTQTTVKRSLGRQHLKIILSFEDSLKNQAVYSKIKKTAEGAARYWEKALYVNVDRQDNLLAQRRCLEYDEQKKDYVNTVNCGIERCMEGHLCGVAKIPDKYLSACYAGNKVIIPEGSGLAQNELLIIVSNYIQNNERDTFVWGTFCERDPKTGREVNFHLLPFIGVVNFCVPEKRIFEINDQNLLGLMKHEIGHVLGFHPTVFQTLPDLHPNFRLSNNKIFTCFNLRGEDIQPFCNNFDEMKCLNYERAYGYCSMYKYGTELPLENQYIDSTSDIPFNETQYYGGASLDDYCPIIQKYQIDENRTSSCALNISLKPDLTTNMLLEDVGRNSICIEHSPMKYVTQSYSTTDRRTASCHKFKCSQGALQIIFNEKEYKCPVKGGIIEIEVKLETTTVYTNITCPRCQTICKLVGPERVLKMPLSILS